MDGVSRVPTVGAERLWARAEGLKLGLQLTGPKWKRSSPDASYLDGLGYSVTSPCVSSYAMFSYKLIWKLEVLFCNNSALRNTTAGDIPFQRQCFFIGILPRWRRVTCAQTWFPTATWWTAQESPVEASGSKPRSSLRNSDPQIPKSRTSCDTPRRGISRGLAPGSHHSTILCLPSLPRASSLSSSVSGGSHWMSFSPQRSLKSILIFSFLAFFLWPHPGS